MEATLALIGRQSSFHNIDIVRDYQPNLPLIPIDENQIEQVFINMLSKRQPVHAQRRQHPY